jgi:ornithine cyclodeaminase/alanine dehydrogenase-like protein (mu-crystallin family)
VARSMKTVFKSVGAAHADLAAATVIHERRLQI